MIKTGDDAGRFVVLFEHGRMKIRNLHAKYMYSVLQGSIDHGSSTK